MPVISSMFPTDVLIEYPLRERENWKVLISESEGGVEQRVGKWLLPIREWDLISRLMPGSTEADVLKNFFRARRGPFDPFLIVMPHQRSTEEEYIGTGDGSRRVWRLPFKDMAFFTARIDGVEKYEGPDYELIQAAGPAGCPLIVWRSAPANGAFIECDGATANLVPLVRLAEAYEDEYITYGRYNSRYRLVEVKADVDPFG